MNSHLAPKIPSFCVANLRNSLLLRAIRRLEKLARSKFSRKPRRGEAQEAPNNPGILSTTCFAQN